MLQFDKFSKRICNLKITRQIDFFVSSEINLSLAAKNWKLREFSKPQMQQFILPNFLFSSLSFPLLKCQFECHYLLMLYEAWWTRIFLRLCLMLCLPINKFGRNFVSLIIHTFCLVKSVFVHKLIRKEQSWLCHKSK